MEGHEDKESDRTLVLLVGLIPYIVYKINESNITLEEVQKFMGFSSEVVYKTLCNMNTVLRVIFR